MNDHEQPEVSELKDMYLHQGMSLRAIAVSLGVSHTAIASWLDQAGIAKRGRRLSVKEVIPFEIDSSHEKDHPVEMLKVLARQSNGEPITDDAKNRLAVFLDASERWVWHYYPGIGWKRQIRTSDDGDHLVRRIEL